MSTPPASDTAAGPLAPRRLDLGGGRRLVVRPVEAGDADGLCRLYDSLGDDDLYRRFFTARRPDDHFFQRAATVVARGGWGIVAAEQGPGGAIVGEANYELQDDGDGELAIAVAPDWRGFLGPYLLDALLEAAAARGVPNLEALILVSNTPMLRLAHARGYASIADDDWCTQRALLSTTGHVPTWPGRHDRPRVLVEVPGARWHAAPAAVAAGLHVLACPGPSGRHTRCPALDGRACPLAAGADAIVVSHARDRADGGDLIRAHRAQHPGVPVCVEPLPGGPEPDPACGEARLPSGDDAAVVAFLRRLTRADGRKGEAWPGVTGGADLRP